MISFIENEEKKFFSSIFYAEEKVFLNFCAIGKKITFQTNRLVHFTTHLRKSSPNGKENQRFNAAIFVEFAKKSKQKQQIFEFNDQQTSVSVSTIVANIINNNGFISWPLIVSIESVFDFKIFFGTSGNSCFHIIFHVSMFPKYFPHQFNPLIKFNYRVFCTRIIYHVNQTYLARE